MKVLPLIKPIVVFAITLSSAALFVLLSPETKKNPSSFGGGESESMARSFVLWLHGLGDSGPANEPIKTLFTSPEFRNTKWFFPSAPPAPVTCNCKSFYVTMFLLLFSLCELWCTLQTNSVLIHLNMYENGHVNGGRCRTMCMHICKFKKYSLEGEWKVICRTFPHG